MAVSYTSPEGHYGIHAVVQILNHSFDEVFSATQFTEVVEHGEQLELLQQSERGIGQLTVV